MLYFVRFHMQWSLIRNSSSDKWSEKLWQQRAPVSSVTLFPMQWALHVSSSSSRSTRKQSDFLILLSAMQYDLLYTFEVGTIHAFMLAHKSAWVVSLCLFEASELLEEHRTSIDSAKRNFFWLSYINSVASKNKVAKPGKKTSQVYPPSLARRAATEQHWRCQLLGIALDFPNIKDEKAPWISCQPPGSFCDPC